MFKISWFKIFTLYCYEYVCMCMICVDLCVTVCMWRSEDNFVKSVLSFHLYIVLLDQTQIIRVEQQELIHTDPFAKQKVLIFKQS